MDLDAVAENFVLIALLNVLGSDESRDRCDSVAVFQRGDLYYVYSLLAGAPPSRFVDARCTYSALIPNP